jgi:hypothetical protein
VASLAGAAIDAVQGNIGSAALGVVGRFPSSAA